MEKEAVFAVLVKQICKVIPELEEHEFRYDDHLKDLGANSLDRVEIVTLTMESLSLKVPIIEVFGGGDHLEEITDLICEKL